MRDFSINTLAVNLREKPFKIIDPFGGRKDLKKKTLRVIREEVFLHDPLRVLRGFSFMANLGFKIQKRTLAAITKHRNLLKNVSGERVSEEFFKILGAANSFKVIKKMDELRVLDEIIPYAKDCRGVYQGKYHHLGVWAHSLETLKQFEVLYGGKLARKKEILKYLGEELAQGRTRTKIIKFACLLHDIGKPFAKKIEDKKTIFHAHEKIGVDLLEDIVLRLRLSFREKDVLKKLTFWHLRPGYLADQVRPTQRAVYRFFRDTQDEGVGVILLSLSDWRATRGPLTDAKRRGRHERIMLKLVDSYFKEKKKKPLESLVDGYDIMRKFNLKPSPIVGEILAKIKEEQALGRVHTKTEGYSIAKKIIQKAKKKKQK
ncbi:MAG: CCA tRNA nucleotidyltransferase [Candidatus Omnitrophota bacterium]|nr:MAG: CCA tRNA nucleotidyltransferase [Candidatus Omnitrophota bacterium]